MCHAICPGHIPIAENLLENQFHRLFHDQVGYPQHVRTILSVFFEDGQFPSIKLSSAELVSRPGDLTVKFSLVDNENCLMSTSELYQM